MRIAHQTPNHRCCSCFVTFFFPLSRDHCCFSSMFGLFSCVLILITFSYFLLSFVACGYACLLPIRLWHRYRHWYISYVMGIDVDINAPVNSDLDTISMPKSISDIDTGIRYRHRYRYQNSDINHHRHRHWHRRRHGNRHDTNGTIIIRPLPSFSWRSPSTRTPSSSSYFKYAIRPARWWWSKVAVELSLLWKVAQRDICRRGQLVCVACLVNAVFFFFLSSSQIDKKSKNLAYMDDDFDCFELWWWWWWWWWWWDHENVENIYHVRNKIGN